MLLNSQDLPNPSVFVTTHSVDCTGPIFSPANYMLITQMFYVLNEQHHAFTCVAQLW
jgi:hypothetical protein